MRHLKGRNAIITGSSYGVGPHLAKALASEGVNVALAARSADRLNTVARTVSAMGVKSIAIPVDITTQEGRDELVARTQAELGAIDILVNNAGVHFAGRLPDRTEEEVIRVIETNLTSSILLTRAVLPHMLQRKTGHLVHIASLAGKVGMPYMTTYSASKYGIIGFNHALQAELRGTGVRSSALCLGFIAEEGMWARFERPVHIAFGVSRPERVARAMLRAIKRDWVEGIVNPMPVRPVLALWALAPRVASRVFNVLRVEGFLKKLALMTMENPKLVLPP